MLWKRIMCAVVIHSEETGPIAIMCVNGGALPKVSKHYHTLSLNSNFTPKTY